MNSKATPTEQDPFTVRHVGRLLEMWMSTLPQDSSGAEVRHAAQISAVERYIPVQRDPEQDASVLGKGARERIEHRNQTMYHADEIGRNHVLIGASLPPPARNLSPEAMRGLHEQRVVAAVGQLEAKGWHAESNLSKRLKGVSSSQRKIFKYLKVHLPQEDQSQAVDALFTDMPQAQFNKMVGEFVNLPDEGRSKNGRWAFAKELLTNPYNPDQLIDNKLAANVIAQRIQHYPHEREPLKEFAAKYQITEAVNALVRGGGRGLGVP